MRMMIIVGDSLTTMRKAWITLVCVASCVPASPDKVPSRVAFEDWPPRDGGVAFTPAEDGVPEVDVPEVDAAAREREETAQAIERGRLSGCAADHEERLERRRLALAAVEKDRAELARLQAYAKAHCRRVAHKAIERQVRIGGDGVLRAVPVVVAAYSTWKCPPGAPPEIDGHDQIDAPMTRNNGFVIGGEDRNRYCGDIDLDGGATP